MDAETRYALVQLLGREMSDLSEECWAAGWVSDTQLSVPELCRRAVETGTPQRWGSTLVPLERARALVYLAELLGCWADLDARGVDFVEFQPFPLPPEVAEAINRDQGAAHTLPV